MHSEPPTRCATPRVVSATPRHLHAHFTTNREVA
jgi:hypothetical protein